MKEERREGNKTSGKKASSLTEREKEERHALLCTEGQKDDHMNE